MDGPCREGRRCATDHHRKPLTTAIGGATLWLPPASRPDPSTLCLAADMQVKEAGKVAGAGERERIARASSPAPPGRRCSSMGPGGSTTIAVILGRSATAFGRRTTQPHQHGDG